MSEQEPTIRLELTREQADFWYAQACCDWEDYKENLCDGAPHPCALESHRVMIEQLSSALGYVGWLEDDAIAEQLREQEVERG